MALALTACGGQKVDLGGVDGGSGGGGDGGPGAWGDGGPASIASEIQQTPTTLASDGTSLFWTSSIGTGGGVSSMPVGGGAITTVVPAPVPGGFLTVDDVNVYYPGQQGGLYSVPKGGGSPTLLTASSGPATVLGSTLFWLDRSGGPMAPMTFESMPLQGGAVTQIAKLDWSLQLGPGPDAIGVTTSTAFLSGDGELLLSFSLASGVPDGGTLAMVPGVDTCSALASDTNAVYCYGGPSMIAVSSDGSATTLGTVIDQGLTGFGVAFDDTYVYWVDSTMVGTIMRAPNTGGAATVIARDTQPIAIAVDANAVYWSDQGGNIMRLAK